MPAPFVHLHTHTEYSLLDGACRIDEAVQIVSQMGMGALAITDHGALYGVIDFYTACQAAGIKPIIGCEIYLAPRSRRDKHGKADGSGHHLVLLAKDAEGYRNLMRIVSAAHVEGFYYKPRADLELLSEHSDGLIATSGCLKGRLASDILENNYASALRNAGLYRDIFGKDAFFVELMDHGLEEQRRANPELVRLARDLGVPVIATNDIHYARREDAPAHDVLLCIQTNSTVKQPNRLKFSAPEFFIKSPDEMAAAFRKIPEALTNTLRVAEMCNVKLELGGLKLPRFEVPEGHTLDSYLRHLCEQTLPERYPEAGPEIRKRLEYELDIIKGTNYSGYFLIVWDFVREAKSRGILTGVRGSAVGSIVTHLLGVSELDPVQHGLPFERLLNPDRKSPPDIDLDLPDDRRDEIIEYVRRKYGADHVAQIITFGTLGARAAIRDAGRALEVPSDVVDYVAKLVPFGQDIAEAVDGVPELRAEYESGGQIRELIDAARSIEGLARHASTHAAGVVVSVTTLTDHVPLQTVTGTDEGVMTQYSMDPLKAVGLVKMDFLGLRTLSVISRTLDTIRETRGVSLRVEDIPLDDPKAYQLLRDGKTAAVFQLEADWIRNFVRNLQPDCFEHMIPLMAINRPGPMNDAPTLLAGRHGGTVSYLHPRLEPILKETYGVILYQEQVMRTAQELAGFSGPQADTLMRAMAKKQGALMAQMKELFFDGCARNGLDSTTVQQIWERMETFARYGFNKAHSAAYGLVSYRTAYLKANYPAEFMAAHLTVFMDDQKAVAKYVTECRRLKLRVRPPSVNYSDAEFTVDADGQVVFGLAAIKNIGRGVARAVAEERQANGPYVGLYDFCGRLPAAAVTKAATEVLIRAGALDELGERHALLSGLDQAFAIGQKSREDRATGQTSLFDAATEDIGLAAEPPLPQVRPADEDERLGWEKELLGVYVSDHPLIRAQEKLEHCTTVALEDLPGVADGTMVVIGGTVSRLSPYSTRNGEQMMFVTLQDLVSEAEVTVFPRVLAECQEVLERDALIVVQGKVQQLQREGADGSVQTVTKVLCHRAKRLADARRPSKKLRETAAAALSDDAEPDDSSSSRTDDSSSSRTDDSSSSRTDDSQSGPEAAEEPTREADGRSGRVAATGDGPLHIHLSGAVSRSAVEALRGVLCDHKGDTSVVIHINGRAIHAGDSYRVTLSPGLSEAISRLVGPDALRGTPLSP